jgi:drug/metabolite transporter (DMT)-like permease
MHRALGVTFIIISAVSFGTLAIFGRYTYASGLDTFTLPFLRFTFSAILMAGLLVIRREFLLRGGTLVRPVGMGALGCVGQSYCYLTAIKYASAGLVALLLNLFPTFVAILSVIFLKAKLHRLRIIALGLATLGAALTVRPQSGQWSGILLALSAAVIYSVYIIVGAGVMRKVSALLSSVVIFLVTLVATVLPVMTFLAGLKLVGPKDSSMLSTLEPVVTVLQAALLFGEILQPLTLLGGGLILGAVLLLTRSDMRQDRAGDHPLG